MRASILFAALITILFATQAADAQTRSRHVTVPVPGGMMAAPNGGNYGVPSRIGQYPPRGKYICPVRPGGSGQYWPWPGGGGGQYWPGGGYPWPNAGRPPFYPYPNPMPYPYPMPGNPWQGGYPPNWCPVGSGSWYRNTSNDCPSDDYYTGGDCNNDQPPPESYPPESYPGPYDVNPYAVTPFAYAPNPYPTDVGYYDAPVAAEAKGWDGYSNYYDTFPVEFAYTPANIAPRAPVVRPNREMPSRVSLIVPRDARKPLFALVAADRPSSETAPTTALSTTGDPKKAT